MPTLAAPQRHRADIDGLRAIAVLGVVLFHYGVVPPAGGFAGVDVFFTISGFLIASVLEREGDRFSLARFYERRVRRLLPALLTVLLPVGLACTQNLPGDGKTVGLGLMHAATMTANLYFESFAESYFAAGSLAIQPTLHTWSLGVEAQFYLLFPALWFAGRRWPAVRAPGLVVLWAASFALSLWSVAHWRAGAFYLLPPRLWEFLLGAALVGLPGPAASRVGCVAAALLGLGLVGAGFGWLTPATPFPGAAALLPCCGTALAIWAGSGGPNPVGAVLGAPPLAALGRLSYALYLWHWPVLVLASYGRPDALPPAERAALLALAFGLAVATHALVERPIIARRRLGRPRTLLAVCGGGTLACLAVGFAINLVGQGKLELARFPPTVLALADGQFDFDHRDCLVGDLGRAECRFGATGAAPSVVLWGNSFAGMWRPGLDVAAGRAGVAGVSLWLSSCPPLVAARIAEEPRCDRFNADALAFVASHPSVRTVILAADWGGWTDRLPALAATVDRLAALGRRGVVMRTPPPSRYDVPRTLALAARDGSPPPPRLAAADARAARAVQDAAIDAVRASHPFAVLDPITVLCPASTCAVERDGRALYYDERHITRAGAVLLSTLFDPLFGAGERPTASAAEP